MWINEWRWIARSTDSSFFGTLSRLQDKCLKKNKVTSSSKWTFGEASCHWSHESVTRNWWVMLARTQVRTEGMGHPWVLLLGVLVWGGPFSLFLQPGKLLRFTTAYTVLGALSLSQSTGHCESAFVEWINGKWCLVCFLGFCDEAPQAG